MGSKRNIRVTDRAARGNDRRDAFIEEIAVQLRNTRLDSGTAIKQSIQANDERQTNQRFRHGRTIRNGVRPENIPVECDRGRMSFFREIAGCVEKVMVFVQTDTNSQTVNFNPASGGGHHEIKRIRHTLFRGRRNRNIFAVCYTPGFSLRKMLSI